MIQKRDSHRANGKRALSRRTFIKTTGLAALGVATGPWVLRAKMKLAGPLYVESWGGSYAEAVKNYIIKPFQEKYDVEVNHAFFGNNAEQLAKLKVGKTTIDVSFLSDTWVYRASHEGVLEPFDVSKMPNFNNLFSKFRKPPYDPGPKVYCTSYFWGDQGIAFNTEEAKKPDSWAALWDKQYKGRVSLYGVAPQPIFNAGLLLGQDPNNITNVKPIMAKLYDLKPNLLKFWMSGAENTQLLATGEVVICDFWRGRVNNLKKEGRPVDYIQPKEGSTGWVDTMVVPKGAPHKETAEAFMNFALTPEIHQQFVLHGINYAPTNSKVKLTSAQADMLGATDQILSRVHFINPGYREKHMDDWTRLINELKA